MVEYKKAIESEFPNLKIDTIKVLGSGWSNRCLLVNSEYVFRFPTSETAIGLLKTEISILRIIREQLDLKVPHFIYEAFAADGEPRFVGYRILNGVNPFADSIQEKSVKARYQNLLSGLIEAVSAIEVDLEKQSFCVIDFIESYRYYRKIYESRISSHLTNEEKNRMDELFDGYLEGIPKYEPTLMHGDLSSDHIFLDPDFTRITGVIDWGEARIGDPDFEYLAIYNDNGMDFVLRLRKLLNLSAGSDFVNKIQLFSLCDIMDEWDSEDIEITVEQLKSKLADFAAREKKEDISR